MRRLLPLTTALAALTACQAPLRPTEPTITQVAAVADDALDRLRLAAEDVLRRRGFDVDQRDLREGRITTRPVTSQHYFELWRRDVETPYDFLEASVMTIRRRAEVHITPADGAGGYEVSVIVRRERFSTPPRQFNNSAAAFQAFGGRLPGAHGEPRLTPAADQWLDDGRDAALEQRLSQEIVLEFEKGSQADAREQPDGLQ